MLFLMCCVMTRLREIILAARARFLSDANYYCPGCGNMMQRFQDSRVPYCECITASCVDKGIPYKLPLVELDPVEPPDPPGVEDGQ